MNHLRRMVVFLGSKTLAVWLVGSFVLYYLTMAVWSSEAFGKYIEHLTSSNLLRLFYAIFVLNSSLLTIRALANTGWKNARTLMRVPLAAGYLLLLISFSLSLNVRDMRWQFIGAGDVMELPWETNRYRVDHVEAALKKKILRGPGSAIFDAEPGVELTGGDGKRYAVGAYPPKRVGSTFMHVLNYGIGPEVELLQGGRSVYQGFVALRLIPFSSQDTFKIDPYPYTFTLSIQSSKVIRRGRETAKSYDLERPTYRVIVTKGDREVARGETATSLSFDGDMTLQFFPPDDWVMLEAAYDPFLPWLAVSILLFIAGLLLYPFSFFFRSKTSGSTTGSISDR